MLMAVADGELDLLSAHERSSRRHFPVRSAVRLMHEQKAGPARTAAPDRRTVDPRPRIAPVDEIPGSIEALPVLGDIQRLRRPWRPVRLDFRRAQHTYRQPVLLTQPSVDLDLLEAHRMALVDGGHSHPVVGPHRPLGPGDDFVELHDRELA